MKQIKINSPNPQIKIQTTLPRREQAARRDRAKVLALPAIPPKGRRAADPTPSADFQHHPSVLSE